MMLATQSLRRALVLRLLLAAASLLPSSVEGAISAQCVSQTNALRDNAALSAAYPDPQATSDASDIFAVSLTLDYTSVSADYKAECDAAGGQFVEFDDTSECEIGGLGAITYFIDLGLPDCFGAACTSAEIVEQYDTFEFPDIESSYAQGGFTCSTTGALSGGTAPTTSGTTAKPAPSSAAAVTAPAPAAGGAGTPGSSKMNSTSGGPALASSMLSWAVVSLLAVISYM